MDQLNRLKVVLAEKGKTNRWLATQLGVSETTVSRWVKNKQQPPLKNLRKIASTLEVDVKALLLSSQ